MPGMYDPPKTTIDLGIPSIAPFTVYLTNPQPHPTPTPTLALTPTLKP